MWYGKVFLGSMRERGLTVLPYPLVLLPFPYPHSCSSFSLFPFFCSFFIFSLEDLCCLPEISQSGSILSIMLKGCKCHGKK